MTPLLIVLSAIFILLVLSAFFSGSETALTAASRPLMHQLEQNGNQKAAIVNRLLTNTDRLIGSILLGNNLVNIFASALATSALITVFGEAGVVYATLGMTLLVLIFSEILPKTFAYRNANKVALWIAPVINVLITLFSPVTHTIRIVVQVTLRMFGADPNFKEGLGPSSEELRGAIELHRGEGTEVGQERAMLRSILDLTEVEVGEIMTHRKNVTMIDADESPEAVVAQVLASPFTRIPLWRGEPDNILGVIHAKALLRSVSAMEGKLQGLDVVELAADPWFVPESTTLLDQLQAFRRRREHFALVVDEYGSLMGIVTLEDIWKKSSATSPTSMMSTSRALFDNPTAATWYRARLPSAISTAASNGDPRRGSRNGCRNSFFTRPAAFPRWGKPSISMACGLRSCGACATR